MAQQYFYDNTVRKWLIQIVRLFSEFTVQYSLDGNGNPIFARIPVIYGDGTFNAQTVLRLNTENMMPSVPLMSIYINNLKYNKERRQNPTYEETRSIRTRQYDAATGQYLPDQGNAYSVSRMMPVPYDVEFKVDIVTSNTNQKLQILEQILPLFNPMMEIQKTDNYMDWGSLSVVEITDVTWSNRSIPVGQNVDSSYDVCTLTFTTPIWMSLPAKVSKMGVIFKVIENIQELGSLNDLVYGTRQVVTYQNYGIYVYNNTIRILNQGVEGDNTTIAGQLYGQPLDWNSILSVYGNIRPGVSEIGLTYGNYANEIVGTITVNPTDSTILLFNANVSTLPANTLPAISGEVNPQQFAPGVNLPAVTNGASYLLLANVGATYGGYPISANANDIVTYSSNANSWITTFSANNNIGNVSFVYNANTSTQIQWNGNAWVQGWEGPYSAANWRLII